jgi:hypothetical protein
VNLQNQRKPRSDNALGLLGVIQASATRFVAQINTGPGSKYIGSFLTAEEAHQAYLSAKRRLHEGNTL